MTNSADHGLGREFGRNLTSSLVDAIGRAIATDTYVNRPFPSEADLVRQYRASRPVVREAVKMVTSKGMLSARPRRGTVVEPEANWNLYDADVLRWLLDRKVSIDLLRRFTELRFAVEPLAAMLAARSAGPDHVRAIAAAFERMTAAEQGEDDALAADTAFHVAVLRASGNPFFAQLRDLVANALRTSIRMTNRQTQKPPKITLTEHEAVLRAIEANDADRAGKAMQHVIGDVLAFYDRC